MEKSGKGGKGEQRVIGEGEARVVPNSSSGNWDEKKKDSVGALEDWCKSKREESGEGGMMGREEKSWAFKKSKRIQRLPEREGKGDKRDLLIREIREMRTEERENRERLKSVLTQIREEIKWKQKQ